MDRFLLISLGAIFGANMRYWVGDWAVQRFGTTFPIGTFIINLTGSFALGMFLTIATERFLLDPRWRLIIAIGFLGGYTTFSSYTYESVSLLLTGQWFSGLLNLLGSAMLGAVAVAGGIILGRWV